jgi:hypothetical protein
MLQKLERQKMMQAGTVSDVRNLNTTTYYKAKHQVKQ